MPRDTSKEHVPTYEVLVDGGELTQEHRDRIKEIRIVDHLRLPHVCTVSISFPQTEGIDTQPFRIGKPLEVRLGAREQQAPQVLFKGDVVSLEPVFGAGGCALTVNAYDRSHLLHRSRKVRVFQNQTATDVVKKVVGEQGLGFEGDSSGDPHDFLQQDNETDWDFIWRLAERCGFEFVVEDQKAYFRKPGRGGAVELEWPDTLSSFRPRMTAVQQVNAVSVFAHDPMTKSAIEAQATTPEQIAQIGIDRASVAGAFPEAEMHVATEPVKSMAEGTALAQALLDKLAIGNGGPPAPDFAAQLVLGVVTNNNDPEDLGRVRVQYPALSSETEGAWARVATASAGKERGLLMLPVVGEEVLVGFEHGDTTRPYVLGSLFNGNDTPGDDLLHDKDGSFVVHSDKHIRTQAKETYTIRADGDLIIEVGGKETRKIEGDWTNETTGKSTLTATQAMSLEGQSMSVKGKADVTIEATASLTLKCSGSQIQISAAGVTISGPMISLG